LKKTLMADGTLLLIAFVWGATFVVVQNAIEFLPPNTFNTIRFLIASLFLLLIVAVFYRHMWKEFTAPLVKAGALIGFWLFAGYAFQTVGLVYTTSAKAGFITGLCVVLVPCFSVFLLKDKIKWNAVAGVLMALVGLALLTLHSVAFNVGDLLVFGCAISFALQIVLTGKYAKHYPALPLAIVQLTTVTILSFVYAFLFEDWKQGINLEALLTPEVFWGLLITAIPATALAFLAQTAFQKQTSSTHVALIFAMEPVFAALTAYVWNNEVLTAVQLIGGTLILAGMVFAELPIASWWKERTLSKELQNKNEKHVM